LSQHPAEFMNKIHLILVLLLNQLLLVTGQEGLPYISYYHSGPEFENGNWSVCQDTSHRVYFANNKGITEFDGLSWNSYSITHIPIEIKMSPSTGELVVLSDRNYGLLKRDDFGGLYFEALTYDGELSKGLKDIWFAGNNIIFCGEQHISFHDIIDHTLKFRLKSETYGRFSGMVFLGDRIWVNIDGRGLTELKGDTIPGEDFFRISRNRQILFSVPWINPSSTSSALHPENPLP